MKKWEQETKEEERVGEEDKGRGKSGSRRQRKRKEWEQEIKEEERVGAGDKGRGKSGSRR